MGKAKEGEPERIYNAISDVMRELSPISKDRTNQGQGFKFRGIEDVYNALHPLLAKHLIFCAPEVLWHEITRIESVDNYGKKKILTHALLQLKFRFYTYDGSFVEVSAMGEAQDHGDKAFGKAASYAHKVAILQLFCVPTIDADDPDKHSPMVEPEVRKPASIPRVKQPHNPVPKQDVVKPDLKGPNAPVDPAELKKISAAVAALGPIAVKMFDDGLHSERGHPSANMLNCDMEFARKLYLGIKKRKEQHPDEF
jgi:hypothetical protein